MIFMIQMKLSFHLFEIASILLLVGIIFLVPEYFNTVDEDLTVQKYLVEPKKDFKISMLWIDFYCLSFCLLLLSMFGEYFIFYLETIKPLKKMFK